MSASLDPSSPAVTKAHQRRQRRKKVRGGVKQQSKVENGHKFTPLFSLAKSGATCRAKSREIDAAVKAACAAAVGA